MTVQPSLDEFFDAIEVLFIHRKYNAMDRFTPYPKQREFFALGKFKGERLLMAGNRVGKSEAGAYETALHLTGMYPDDWPGRRFHRPGIVWAAGETSIVVRDVQQKKLCGNPGVVADLGSGMIPKKYFVDTPTMARGASDAFDTVQIAHHTNGVCDGTSVLRFKSYEQGRTKFQGEGLQFLWCDEEPDETIYSEAIARIAPTTENPDGGIAIVTFTPMKGKSKVVLRFMEGNSRDRVYVTMSINEAKHISPALRAQMLERYPAHEREARANGVPMLGSGKVFTASEESIIENPLEYIPLYWTKLVSIDFGIDHPFAWALEIWDRDNDVIHLHAGDKMSDQTPLQHAQPILRVAGNVPIAWPHDGNNRDKGSGKALSAIYREQKLQMLPEHATFETGGYSLEAGILEMDQRMRTGRFKVSAVLGPWFDEYREYHRKDGVIVPVRDDFLGASRVGVMAKRHGRAVPLGGAGKRRKRGGQCKNVDFDMD